MIHNKVRTEDEAINWINSLKSFGIKPGLDRMKWMLEKFKNPEQTLKFIHIAGTNGKGSTVSYLKNVLIEAGYTVGTFTSPYIIDFKDRIQVNGEDISGEDLTQIVNKIMPIVEEVQGLEWGSPTEFEVITLIAIIYFGEVVEPDIVLFETGLGGRLDSTNVVSPVLSIITNVSYDHTNILGNDITDIAREKGGIIKDNIPLISGVENEEALSVIKKIVQEKASPIYQINEHFFQEVHKLKEWGSEFDFKSEFVSLSNIKIEMIGRHQIKNTAIALMALQILADKEILSVDTEAIYRGVKKTSWPGRFEKILKNPPVIIDGAHNLDSAKSLRDSLQLCKYKKLIMVVGILKDKDVKEYFQTIIGLVDKLIITEPQIDRAAKVDEVRCVIDSLPQKTDLIEHKNWKEAVDKALKISSNDDLVIITGSLYLISDVRKYLLETN